MSQPKKRDAEATTERILVAAQQTFHDKGYDAATTREIADRAGVNLALITRYFGSKRGLFERAVLPHLSLGWFLKDGLQDGASRLADFYVNTALKGQFDPFVVLLRSVSSAEAGPMLADAIQKQAIDPLQDAIGGPEAEARATLLATQLAGLILWFRVMDKRPRDARTRERIRKMLTDHLSGLLTPE